MGVTDRVNNMTPLKEIEREGIVEVGYTLERQL